VCSTYFKIMDVWYCYLIIPSQLCVEIPLFRSRISYRTSCYSFCCYEVEAHSQYPQQFLTFMWPYIATNLFVIKPTRCTNFTNLFCHETQHVSDSSSVHHQEFIHCTLSSGYIIQVCRQLSSRTRSCSKAVYKPASIWFYYKEISSEIS